MARQTKSNALLLRLTPDQRTAFQAAAEAEGLSLSAWIIRTCLMALKGKK